MRSEDKKRRFSPALVVAVIALIASLSGTAVAAHLNGNHLQPRSVGGGKLKPFTGGLIKPQTVHGSKLRQFTGGLIRPETVPPGKMVPNSLGTRQINEANLGPVPSADRLTTEFNARIAYGESAELAAAGPFTLTAQCIQNGTTADGTEGRDFVRLLIGSSEPGSVFTSGVGSLTGNGPENFLGPDTEEANRIVDEVWVANGNSNFKTGGHFNAMAANGAGLSSAQGSTSAALNLFDTGCSIQGTANANG